MINKNRILNSTLADLRGRVDTLAKSIFLIGGGSITLSINIYLDKKNQLADISCYLKNSWWWLLISILLFALVIGLLILQGYLSSEFYRRVLEKNKKIKKHPRRYLDHFALFIGIFGFFSFFIGMVYLILAAIHL